MRSSSCLLQTCSDPEGQTTFCSALIQHLRNNKRSCFYVNLDPAAEDFVYEPDLDIKDLISLADVMEEIGLGPNGGLIYCFEYVVYPGCGSDLIKMLQIPPGKLGLPH